jgi:uncharacterized damage-inducible protein DinB
MSEKERFLETYEREHATTMRVLRAFPPEKADLRPHPKCKTARELAWVFVSERRLGAHLMNDSVMELMKQGTAPPPPPDNWGDLLDALERAHQEYGEQLRGMSEEELNKTSTFFVGPKTPGPQPRMQLNWMLLHDQIHHRGQFSIYLRMADGRVPSIYGPTADEPWV